MDGGLTVGGEPGETGSMLLGKLGPDLPLLGEVQDRSVTSEIGPFASRFTWYGASGLERCLPRPA